MKVLFDGHMLFMLAHGGAQTQIEQTKAGLETAGVEVEYLRSWDDRQRGDLIHYFGVAGNLYLSAAKAAKLPVIMTPLLTATCNRSDARLACQGYLVRLALALPFGESIKQQLTWRAFNNCTHHVVGIQAEEDVLLQVYRVPPENVSVVPLGLSKTYLDAGPGTRRETHLICTGTITERKNSIELAEMARAAKTPILFVGKPYHPSDLYWLHFKTLIENQFVKHREHVSDEPGMISLLQAARGFVLMSNCENWCLSAHEAAACGLPLLVQEQKWSRERFGNQAHYFEHIGVSGRNIEILRQFYADAPDLPPPKVKHYSWTEVARQLAAVYDQVLRRTSV